MRTIDHELLSLADIPRHRQGELFLKGPIPWSWLALAMSLSGKAVHVGLALWLRAGIGCNGMVSVNLSRLPFDRSSASRGLAALEGAGLVRVTRRPGRKPVVMLLTPPSSSGRLSDSNAQAHNHPVRV